MAHKSDDKGNIRPTPPPSTRHSGLPDITSEIPPLPSPQDVDDGQAGARRHSPVPAQSWEGPPAGSVLDGAYRIVGPLGQGGMGVVMLAWDQRLERDVAIKLIRPGQVASADAHQRFLVEARAMARIRHENVVEIYAYGETGDSPYFVMEYVPGTNLANWLDDGFVEGRLPAIDEALGYIEQICRGVSAIHASGTVHGDLKPGNILLGPASRVAVADMGLSRVLDTGDGAENHPMAGTPAYIPPEFARTDLSPEMVQRSDVYALGVIAYEMLTGEQPHEIQTTADMLRVHAGLQAPLPSTIRPDLTTAFDGPLLDALATDPLDRTPTPDDFRKALWAARESLTASATTLRILVADDDEDFRELACEVLAHGFPGAQIVAAGDGAEALRASDAQTPSLAVIDLDMPGMNGVELTAALRAASDVPIVVVTAAGGAPDWKLLQALGAEGFLVKPIDPYALTALARKALKRI